MDFKLNTFSVKDHERAKMMNYEQLASQIITALTGAPAPAPVYSNGMMNQGYPQQGNMMNQNCATTWYYNEPEYTSAGFW